MAGPLQDPAHPPTKLHFSPTNDEAASDDPNSKPPAPTANYTYTIDVKHHLRSTERNDVNVYYKVVNLLGYLFTTEQVELVRFDDLLSPIREAPLIPQNEEALLQYIRDPHVSKRHALHYIFKIKVYDIKFYDLKRRLIPWLKQHNIFLSPTHLTTGRNCVIGWLLHTHPRFTHRISTKSEIAYRIHTEIPFHLVPRVIRSQHGAPTRALAIECAVTDAASLEEALIQHFQTSHEKYLVTNHVQYIPMSANGEITDSLLAEMVGQQRKFYSSIRHIIIRSPSELFSPTWVHTDSKGDSWRLKMCDAIDSNNTPLFPIIDTGPENRIYAFTYSSSYTQASQWIKKIEKELKHDGNHSYTDEDTESYFDASSKHDTSLTSTYASVLKRSIAPKNFFHDTSQQIPPPAIQRCRLIFGGGELTTPSPSLSEFQNTQSPNRNADPTPVRSNVSPNAISDVTDSNGSKSTRMRQFRYLHAAQMDTNSVINEIQKKQRKC